MAAVQQAGAISKRRKFVADGVFYAELNEFFQRELAEEGYSGANPGPSKNELAVMATRKLRETDWHTRPGWPAASQPSADVGTWHNTRLGY